MNWNQDLTRHCFHGIVSAISSEFAAFCRAHWLYKQSFPLKKSLYYVLISMVFVLVKGVDFVFEHLGHNRPPQFEGGTWKNVQVFC